MYISEDGSYMKRRLALSREEEEALDIAVKESWNNKDSGRVVSLPDAKCDINSKQVPNGFNNNDSNSFVHKNNYVIPDANAVAANNASSNCNGELKQGVQPNVLPNQKNKISNGEKRLERPTQLSLSPGDNFVFPGGLGMHLLGSSPTTPSSQPSQPQSPSGQLSPSLVGYRCPLLFVLMNKRLTHQVVLRGLNIQISLTF